MQTKKILLTGATGFIGRNISEQLQELYEIYAPSSHELNLLDTDAVQKFLQKNSFDVVIHAANRNETRNRITPYDSLNGNLRMFFNLERCHDLYGKMIYFGSGAEYDRENYKPDMPEEYFGVHIPKDAYGFSKYIMAKNCLKSENIYDLCLFGVYGKYEEWERRFISNAICRALKGREITIQRNVYFDYLWIDDLTEILKWFIENKPEKQRYNVCRGQKIDLYSLGEIVRDVLGTDSDIVVAEEGYKPEYTGSNQRLLEEIGQYSFAGFEETVAELCAYYKTHLGEIDEGRL